MIAFYGDDAHPTAPWSTVTEVTGLGYSIEFSTMTLHKALHLCSQN